MKLKSTIIVIMLCSFMMTLYGQDAAHCDAVHDSDTFFANNPLEKVKYDILTKNAKLKLKAASKGMSAKSSTSWEIPVVFHVFGETQWGKTVTYEKIKNALEVVNDDFNGLNHDF